MRALVVDDEEPALVDLKYLLGTTGDFEFVEGTQSAVDALKLMRQARYDVIFLDIQMPGLTGIELANILREFALPPLVVFVTAYDEHAVKAFELQAADYLLKPVSLKRLEDTVQRLKSRLLPGSQLPVARASLERLEKLPVETEGKTVLIDLSEIRYAVAQGDLVQVKAAARIYSTRYSIAELEARLPSPPFMRTHRSYLVNLRNVTEIFPYFNGAYLLKMNDAEQTEVPVSRGQARTLRALLGM